MSTTQTNKTGVGVSGVGVSYGTFQSGYYCHTCGVYVSYNTPHTCTPQYQPYQSNSFGYAYTPSDSGIVTELKAIRALLEKLVVQQSNNS